MCNKFINLINTIADLYSKKVAQANQAIDAKMHFLFLSNEQAETLTGGVTEGGCIPDPLGEKIRNAILSGN